MNKTVKAIKEEFEEEYQYLLEDFKLEESQDEEFLKKLLEEEVKYNECVQEIIGGTNYSLEELQELLKELQEKYLPRILYYTGIERDIEDEISDLKDFSDRGNQFYIGDFYSDIIRYQGEFRLLYDFISNGLVHEDLDRANNFESHSERDIFSRVRYTKLLSDYVTKSEIRKIIEELEEEYKLTSDEESILEDIDEELDYEELKCSSTIKNYIIRKHTTQKEEEY